jgi:hypothetical protein
MKNLFFFFCAVMIFSSMSMAQESAQTGLIPSLQERCLKGEISICDALKTRAHKLEARCDTCTIEADKDFCLEERRCWNSLYSFHKNIQDTCKYKPEADICSNPVTERIKTTFALCQMQGEICS